MNPGHVTIALHGVPIKRQRIAVRPGSPIQSLKDLLVLAQKDPGKLTYGSAGVGSILAQISGWLDKPVGVNNLVKVLREALSR